MNTILIPTIKTLDEIKPLIDEINATASSNSKLVISSSKDSVAININRGLDGSCGEFVLKIDDDLEGLPFGWDSKLLEPFSADPAIGVVSARLLNKDGSVQLTCSRNVNLHPKWVISERPIVPFCFVAFRNNGIRMDENLVGSGYDDVDYCNQLRLLKPGVRFAIHNEVRVIHKHEQKNSKLNENAIYFRNKWLGVSFPDGLGIFE